NVVAPAKAGARCRSTLGIEDAPCDLAEFAAVAEHTIQRHPYRAGGLRQAHCGIDFGPASAKQLRWLALPEAEVERDALAGGAVRQPDFPRPVPNLGMSAVCLPMAWRGLNAGSCTPLPRLVCPQPRL